MNNAQSDSRLESLPKATADMTPDVSPSLLLRRLHWSGIADTRIRNIFELRCRQNLSNNHSTSTAQCAHHVGFRIPIKFFQVCIFRTNQKSTDRLKHACSRVLTAMTFVSHTRSMLPSFPELDCTAVSLWGCTFFYNDCQLVDYSEWLRA